MVNRAKEKKKPESTKDNTYLNLDNEIIIGIKTLPKPVQKPSINKKNKNRRKNKKKKVQKVIKKNNNIRNKKQNKKRKEITPKQQQINKAKRIATYRIIKWTTVSAIIIAGGIYFLLSPFFYITKIDVIGNEIVTEQELISLSGIKLDENTFKIQNKQVEQNIKQNAYIDKVSVTRKLPDKIEISVKEREPTFMLSFGNAYIYINNQGYLLEISKMPINKPVIVNFSTPEEELHVGNRLCSEDLQKLEQALQIIKSAESNGILDLITSINISDKQDFVLELKTEKKLVHIGDSSNLSTKMLYIITILEDNKDIEGEIFVNTNMINKNPYFRKKV